MAPFTVIPTDFVRIIELKKLSKQINEHKR